ncbi:MAG: DUF3696 domain-containing protein [Planctomycetaceae bacterium]|jgi:predicted ATPase|nr:DUF3696 domain-containing protein [Planctomycetaceae bacterium]
MKKTQGITKLSVAGFKSIASEITLDIKPLTLLAGANSSGKSSFMQPLLLLKQTLEAPYAPSGLLLLNGENVKFTLYEQMFSKGCDKFTFRIDVPPEYCSASFEKISGQKEKISGFISSFNNRTRQIVCQVLHVPGLRGNPERVYQATGTGPDFPKRFEYYTASIIASWAETKSDKLDELCQNLSRLGLTSKISAKRLNDAQIEVMVNRLPKNGRNRTDMVNIADVGFGVSQTLPILVALLTAESGQLVYLEQPEIHLHPRAQQTLAEILVEAANRGVKVVAETHSALLLITLQTLVAKRQISTDIVALHWFQRDKNGTTEVSTAKLSEKGTFGNWPVDFGKVELEAEGNFIDAVASARKGTK